LTAPPRRQAGRAAAACRHMYMHQRCQTIYLLNRLSSHAQPTHVRICSDCLIERQCLYCRHRFILRCRPSSILPQASAAVERCHALNLTLAAPSETSIACPRQWPRPAWYPVLPCRPRGCRHPGERRAPPHRWWAAPWRATAQLPAGAVAPPQELLRKAASALPWQLDACKHGAGLRALTPAVPRIQL
jgi:hypothetical protein